MKLIELLQSFIYQIACLKQFRLLKIRFSLEKKLKFFNFFEARLACLRIQNFFRNWYCLWKNLECFILWKACRKTQIFNKPLQYVKRIEIFQNSKAQNLAEKTQSFLEPIHSRKWIEIIYKFLARIACLKICEPIQWSQNFCEPIQYIKKIWMFSIFWSLSSLQEKKSGKIFVYEASWKNGKSPQLEMLG